MYQISVGCQEFFIQVLAVSLKQVSKLAKKPIMLNGRPIFGRPPKLVLVLQNRMDVEYIAQQTDIRGVIFMQQEEFRGLFFGFMKLSLSFIWR